MQNFKQKSVIPTESVRRSILLLRGQRVIIDVDLAELYGVSTKALNQAVKRNKKRFPEDFVFQLKVEEKTKVVTYCDHLKQLKYSSSRPFAFTEHGALMAASVLSSVRAVEMSIHIIRTFVHLRKILAGSADLARRMDDLEKQYDKQFIAIFQAIKELMKPPLKSDKKRIGFLD